MRGVRGPQIAEVLAELHSHLAETGESPRESFGSPRAYADETTAALGGTEGATRIWRSILTWSTAAYGIGTGAGAWLLLDGVLAASSARRGPLHLAPAASMLVGLVILSAMAVGLARRAHWPDTPVLDPRTGTDMTPPLPRWVLPVMVTPPVLSVVLAVLVAVMTR